MEAPERPITLGRIVGLFGVRGWVKVYSHTDPRESILEYARWWLPGLERWKTLAEGRRHGPGLVARLDGVEDRDAAALLMDQEVCVDRSQLPPLEEGAYYWADLEGCRVETMAGESLGEVSHLFTTGANDVLVVQGERERLIPFLLDEVIIDVDLVACRIRVDWDPDF